MTWKLLWEGEEKGNDEEDDGKGEGDGLEHIEGSDESGLLKKSGD
jgi:hypothetical protein